MSKKTGILDHHQQETDTPREYVKRSVADMLVNRLMADRIHSHLVKRRAVNFSAVKSSTVPLNPPRFLFVPDELPPAELPGLKFKQTPAMLLMQAQSQIAGFRKLRMRYV